MLHLVQPTTALVVEHVDKFMHDPQTATVDAALTQLFTTLPRNDQLQEVLIKVAALNSLYSTNIYAVYRMAQHILALEIDSRLFQHEVALIDDIARLTIGTKQRVFYSFATKYCSWHYPDAYPIYDSYVDYLLVAYQKRDHFARFRPYELRDYVRYTTVLGAFRSFYNLEVTFKDLDKFLWWYGKEVYAQISASTSASSEH